MSHGGRPRWLPDRRPGTLAGVTSSGAVPVPERGGAVDYRGGIKPDYAPRRDNHADPGEVVWAWVPYAENPHIGKDRPILVLGRADRGGLLGALQLTSRDHDGDSRYVPVGSGGWDPSGRPSWVRLDRPLAVAPTAVRRTGAGIDRRTFTAVVKAARLAAPTVVRRRPGLVRRLVRRLAR